MSTRRERKNRLWMRCYNCGAWRGSTKGKRPAGHFDPFTKTYLCERVTGDGPQGITEQHEAVPTVRLGLARATNGPGQDNLGDAAESLSPDQSL